MSHQGRAAAVLYAKSLARITVFYEQVFGLEVTHSEAGHVVLESPTFQLVVLAIPESIAAAITVATPPVRREDTPIKLVFYVKSISATREVAASLGGELNPLEQEWHFQGSKACDGHDPEGNVVQFRETAL